MRTLIAIAMLAACADPEVTLDAGIDPPADGGAGTLGVNIPSIEGPSLTFGGASLSDDRLELGILANGLSRVYGIAYRIEFDPAILTFDRLERSPAFLHDDLFEVREATPGVLVVAMSAKGSRQGIDLDGAAIARATFTLARRSATELRITRPFALDEEGRELAFRTGRAWIVEQ